MRANARVRVRCRVSISVGLRYRLSSMGRVTVGVRARFQEAQSAESMAVQLFPWGTQRRVHGRVPVMLILWVPRPASCVDHSSVGSQQPPCAGPLGFGNGMVMFPVPCQVSLHHIWGPCAWFSPS